MRNSNNFAKRAGLIAGRAPLTGARLTHVVSTVRGSDGHLEVIKIDAEAPRSDTDAFILELARTRADAIVTTGRILREETELSHELAAPSRAWRSRELGKDTLPFSVVITRSGDIDLDHRLFHGEAEAWILADEQTIGRVDSPARRPGTRLFATPCKTVRDTLEWLWKMPDIESISLECGPSTVAELYREPPLVDELILAICEGADAQATNTTGRFLHPREIEAIFGPAVTDLSVREGGLHWRFLRFCRSIAKGTPEGDG